MRKTMKQIIKMINKKRKKFSNKEEAQKREEKNILYGMETHYCLFQMSVNLCTEIVDA